MLTKVQQQALMGAIQDGLPLTSRPYLTLARALNLSEQLVIDTLHQWLEGGLIKRMGLVVNHKKLGYTANAMVVWDIPDQDVDQVGEAFKASGLVTLCYRRPRRLPDWPYNLFCMIHGRDRGKVIATVDQMVTENNLDSINRDILFSYRQYKQRGGRYARPTAAPAEQPIPVARYA